MELTWFSVLLIFLALIIASYFYIYFVKGANLPPKIRGYPFLGLTPWMKREALEKIVQKLKKTHGDVFTVYFGTTPIVMLASYDAIKETLKQAPEIYSGRPYIFTPQYNTRGGKGIIMHQYGESWKDLRKFTLQVLRDFGVGKSSLEDKIVEEVEALRNEISSRYSNKAFYPKALLQNAVSNIICSINFGSRYDYNDQKFSEILETMDKLFHAAKAGQLIDIFPWLRFIPGLWHLCLKNESMIQSDKVHDYIKKKVNEHRETFDPSNIRDFVDLYLKAETGDNLSKYMDESQMLQAIWDMFNAGTETTSTTLQWALLFLLHHPNIQDKIHEEIDRVIGSGRCVRMKDKGSLPYTNAFLLEVQRYATIVPCSLAHATTCDAEFRGYHIAKDTNVWACLYCAHRDPKYYKDPELFDPDRWLNKDGTTMSSEALIPFSTGHRICLGEQLARMELLLFFVGLLQSFRFKSVGPLPSYDDAESSVTRSPLPYEIIAEVRR